MNKKYHKTMKKLQKGFTLVELAIVGIFLGLLAVFAISQFTGSATDVTRANSIREAAAKIGDNWSVLATTCGTATNVTAQDLSGVGADAAAGNLSLLVGNAQPAAAFQACWAASGLKPLSGLTIGAAGAEALEGNMTVTLIAPNATSIGVQVANVPTNLALQLYRRLSSQANARLAQDLPAAADQADPQFRFTAPAGGTTTVTIVRPV